MRDEGSEEDFHLQEGEPPANTSVRTECEGQSFMTHELMHFDRVDNSTLSNALRARESKRSGVP